MQAALDTQAAASHRVYNQLSQLLKVKSLKFPFLLPFSVATTTIFACLTESLLIQNFELEVVLEENW